MTGPTGNPWTDEDVEWLTAVLANVGRGAMPEKQRRHDADAILAHFAPRVVAMVRAGQAEALEAVRARALDKVHCVTEGPMVSRIKVAGWCDSVLREIERGE